MKRFYCLHLLCLLGITLTTFSVRAQKNGLKLVFIRHAERPENGDNLSCKGLNRSLLLPAVLYRKFGKPTSVYVPALKASEKTKHARMFQTISPFAIKYNLNVNSTYEADDDQDLAKALLKESGTVIIVWEHHNIRAIIDRLGISSGNTKWPDADFDSIRILTYSKGKAIMTKDKEGILPQSGCKF
jgi:hypothetical protein